MNPPSRASVLALSFLATILSPSCDAKKVSSGTASGTGTGTASARPSPSGRYGRIAVDVDYGSLHVPPDFTPCDGTWFDEKNQAKLREAKARTSNSASPANLHARRLASTPRLVETAQERKLVFMTMDEETSSHRRAIHDVSFIFGEHRVLVVGPGATNAMVELIADDRTYYPDIAVLGVMFPSAALVAHLGTEEVTVFDDPSRMVRVFAVDEPPETILRAFDEVGAQAVRASCEHNARGYILEAQERPGGWGYRHASVALPIGCGDNRSDLHLWVRRIFDTTIVLACGDGTCDQITKSIHVRAGK